MASRFHDLRAGFNGNNEWSDDSVTDPNANFDPTPLIVCLFIFIAGAIAMRLVFKCIYNSILFDDETPSITSMYSIASSVEKNESTAYYSNVGYQHAERIIP
ncbi:hypothetical protein PFISCL1PPCAC_28291 [Pristionchus fissidentatus]|uniref:Uncharacterized protein n=1 Tax=Pristionchus fissidentatus TaxID=1538716 RepID=A0AAV5WYP5_9BILA|nr:hypothetical protein PFISCL1PPCAC_28291 [Pristionchus fissidentatus]